MEPRVLILIQLQQKTNLHITLHLFLELQLLNLETIYTSKIINCLQEVSSRNSPIILITNQGSKSNSLTNSLQNVVTINVRENTSYSSLLGAIPLQLIAYYLSIEKGINPDKPKNLAKVVTVE